MGFLKAFVVVLLVFTVVMPKAKKAINKPKVRGHIGEIFKMLIPPQQTLMFISQSLNGDCIEAMKQSYNPRVILDINRPIQIVRNMTYTYIICTDSLPWLRQALKKLKLSILLYKSDGLRGRYFVISGKRNFTKMGMEFLRRSITKVTFLKREKDETFSNQTLNKLKAPLIISPPYYTVINNVLQIPNISRIEVVFPRSMRNGDPSNQIRFHLMYKSACLMASALNVDCAVTEKCCSNKDLRCICLFVYYTNQLRDRNHYLEASAPYFIDTEVLFVPRVTMPNPIQSIIFVFAWSTVAILLAVFVFFILFCWLVSRLLKEDLALRRLGSWVLIAIQYTLGFAITKLPRSNSLRILLIFFMYYSLQVSYVYQSNMTSVLSEPNDEPEIDTLQDLSNTNIQLLLYSFQKCVLNEKMSGLYNTLEDRILRPPEGIREEGRLAIASKNKYATNMGNEMFQYAYPQYAQKFYPLKYLSFLQQSIGFFIPKGHYMYEKVHFYIRQLTEGGFQEKILTEAKKKYGKNEADKEESPNIYLRFVHLKEVFIFWAVGMLIATAAFLCELFNFYCFRRFMDWLRSSDRWFYRYFPH